MAVALVPVVRLLHPERHPAEPRLREEHLEIGEAVEDAGEDHLREAHRRRRCRGTAAPPTRRWSGREPREHRGIGAGILEGRLRGARPEPVEADVHGERHPHGDGGRPEPVVRGRRIALAAREHAERHAAEAERRAVLELGDGVVDVGPRDDAEPDEAVARDRAVLLAEPVVVGANRRAVRVVVGSSCARAAGPSACSGRAPRRAARPDPARAMRCSGGPTPAVSSTVTPNGCHVSLVRPARRSRKGTGPAAPAPPPGARRPPSGELDRPRRLVAIPRRHPCRPALGKHFEMPITRNQRRQAKSWPRGFSCRRGGASLTPRGSRGRGGSRCEAAPDGRARGVLSRTLSARTRAPTKQMGHSSTPCGELYRRASSMGRPSQCRPTSS